MAAHAIDELADLVGGARLVLLGESTHGTHEFYALRAELTRRLIADHGFGAVAIEADWPAAARVDRYIRGEAGDACAAEALGGFGRFPPWMWRNQVIADLVEWLRGRGAGFYGLDLYSLRESMAAVVDHLDGVDPAAAARARRRYACFEGLSERAYGQATLAGEKDPCEDEVVAQLRELLAGTGAGDAHFAAVQNARLAADAECFFRAMYRADASVWNLRDAHMADTLDAIVRHTHGRGVVVWAHNAHVGDARATEQGRVNGELSLGQLARERHPGAACLVGFTTHAGSVTAARDWGAPAEHRRLRPSLAGSVERLLHDAGLAAGVIDLRAEPLGGRLIERMVGAVYQPEAELWSHYMAVEPARQFDLVVHVDESTALEPLEGWAATEDPAEASDADHVVHHHRAGPAADHHDDGPLVRHPGR